MRSTEISTCFLALVLTAGVCLFPARINADEEAMEKGTKMQRAIWHFKHENYEEALEVLNELEKAEPGSSTVAYYLGRTYKKLQNYNKSIPYFEKAATLHPRIISALMELIDTLYQKGRLKEAKKWIKVAEDDDINPAQTAFMKGLVFLKEGSDIDGAIASFEKAKALDPAIGSSADYYIGLAHMKAERLAAAKEMFLNISAENPNTSLAAFADQYASMISQREEAMRPFRGQISAAMQYDSNVMLKPDDPSYAPAVGDAGDWRQAYTLNLEYNVNPLGTYRTKFGYGLYLAKQVDLGFYDTVSHNFMVQPGIYGKKITVTFPCKYNYVTINDKGYLQMFEAANINNISFTDVIMLQFGLTYKNKKFLWAPSSHGEDRDSNEGIMHVGWFYFFPDNKGYVNLKYTGNYDHTEEGNWRYLGNKGTVSFMYQVLEKMKFNSTADFLVEYFTERNATTRKKRRDGILTLTSFLTYEIFEDTEIMLSYTYTDDMSNERVYDYTRHIYSTGMVYKF